MHNQDVVKVLDENRAEIKQRLMQHESSSRAVTGTDQRQTKTKGRREGLIRLNMKK